MQPSEILRILKSRWLYVVVPVVLSLGLAAYVTATATRIYEASSSVYFTLPFSQSATDLLQGANYTQQQLASYASLATKPIVLDRVVENLDLDVSARSLRSSVSVVAAVDTVIIEVRASSTSPEMAADISNAVTTELAAVAQELSPTDESGEPVIEAVVVEQAADPSFPSSPNRTLNMAAGLLGGLFLGLLAAFGREALDNKVRDETDIPDGLPVLATLFFDKAAKSRPVVVGSAKSRLRAESFRRLRTNLHFIGVDGNPVRVVAVTSAVAGEGKTSVSVNLALVLAEAGQRVLLVDADLRLPRVAAYLGLEPSVGLTDVLSGRVDVAEALQDGPSDLQVLACGTVPPNPSELLGSHHMAALLATLRSAYDYIVIDTPALLPVTDGAVAAAQADGAVMVAGYGRSKQRELERAVDTLNVVGARILGIVFNRVPRSQGSEQDAYGPYLRTSASDRSRMKQSGKHTAVT